MEDRAESEKEIRIQGIAVSEGIARGPVFLKGKKFREPARIRVDESRIEGEHGRLEVALHTTRDQIREMHRKVLGDVGAEDAAIFEAHLLVLEDSTVIEQVKQVIDGERVCADYAFWSVMKRYIDSLRAIDDNYLSERVIDIEDVSRRVLRNLRGASERGSGGESRPGSEHILASHDLTPSDTVMLDRKQVLGFVTEVGGTTSHTAIMARSLQIPAVAGIPHLESHFRSGDTILLDGYGGLVIVRPSEGTLAHYRALEEERGVINQQMLDERQGECKTLDGRGIVLSANIEFAGEAEDARSFGAQGVGLFRTEFAYLHGDRPTEDSLAAGYEEVASRLAPELVIFRTVDLGGDKLDAVHAGSPEPNPFLGWRGIRYCLQRRQLFEEQLRALLRASASGKVGIMFPLISSVSEVLEAREILEGCKTQLAEKGIAFDPEVQVGAMVEVPSAAVAADLIAPHVDFLSIGTNDLVQYTLAVDRVNEAVAHLYQPSHPAVLRLIRHTCKAARENDIWVGICGEMAGDLNLTPLLLGLGLDEFSVVPALVPRVKYALRKLDASRCEELAAEWLALSDGQEIYEASRAIARIAYPGIAAV